MRPLALLTLLALPGSALARSHVDRWMGRVGEVAIEGTVEVPLVRPPARDAMPLPCVLATIGDKTYVLAVDGAHDVLYLDEGVVGDAGAKVRSHNRRLLNFEGEAGRWRPGGEIKTARIDEIRIGDLALRDVRVVTSDVSEKTDELATALVEQLIEDHDIDGVIGMGALPELAWAVLPSEGVVRFAPAERASELLDAVGGTVLDYSVLESADRRFGKERFVVPELHLVVQARVGDADVRAQLLPATMSAVVGTAAPVGEGRAEFHRGDREFRYLDVRLGDLDLGRAWFYRWSGFELLAQVPDADLGFDAVIGLPLLAGFDIAADPASHRVALAPAEKQLRAFPHDELISQAEKELEESADEADGKKDEGGEADEDEGPGADAWARVAELRRRAGNLDGALAALEEAAKADEKNCSRWLELGELRLAAGDAEGAVEALEKAAELYESWWGLDYALRRDYARHLDAKGRKLPGKVAFALFSSWHTQAPPEGLERQDASCHVVYGWLAAAEAAAGDTDTVERIYHDHLDLDPLLAIAAGNARLVAGDAERAQEPFRQAVLRERTPDVRSRVGLGVTYARLGDLDTADGLFRKALETRPYALAPLVMWLDAIREAKGAEAALAAARDWAEHGNPDAVAAWLALAREAKLAGDDATFAKARSRVDALFERAHALGITSVRLAAMVAMAHLLDGDLDAAAKEADEALEQDPTSAAAWFVKARIAEQRGDEATAEKARRRARMAEPFMLLFQL